MAEVFNFGFEDGTTGELGTINNSGSASTDATAGAAQADTGFGLIHTFAQEEACYSTTNFTVLTGTDCRFRFYIDASNLTVDDGEDFSPIALRRQTGYPITMVHLTQDSGQYKIWARTTNNSHVFENTTTEPNFDKTVPHYVEVHVFRGNGTGFLKLYVDGEEVASKTGISNHTEYQPGSLWEGAQGAGNVAGAGSFAMDELVLRDDSTEIGPYTGSPEGMITHEGGTSGEYDDVTKLTGDTTFPASGLATTGYKQLFTFGGAVSSYGIKNVVIPVDSVYRIRCYIDTTNLTMTNGNLFAFLFTRTASTQILIAMEQKSGSHYLSSYTAGAIPSYADGTTAITAGEHYVEILADMAAGTTKVYLDASSGTPEISQTGGPNNAIAVIFCGVSAADAGTSGSFAIDEIAWRPYNVEIGAWTPNILDVDFETGSVTEHGGVDGTEGAVAAVANPTAALASTNFGMALDLDANDDAYVDYPLPGIAATTMRARFYFDLNTWANNDTVQSGGPLMFRESTNDQFGIKTEVNSGTEAFNGWYRTNSGTVQMTTETAVTSGWVEMEFCWHASAGYFKWWLDGVLQEEDTGLATDSVTVPDSVRFGWTDIGSSGNGVAYLDELIVRNQASSLIGTDGAGLGFEIDLTTSIATSNATPDQDENFTITVDVTNASASQVSATGVTVEIPVPANATYVSDDSSSEYDDETGVWTLTDIAPGGTEQIVITFTMDDTTPADFTAEVTAADQADSTSTWDNGSGDDYDEVTVTGQAVAAGGAPQTWRFSR